MSSQIAYMVKVNMYIDLTYCVNQHFGLISSLSNFVVLILRALRAPCPMWEEQTIQQNALMQPLNP